MMDIKTLYSVKIKDCNSIFKDSVAMYRDAVDFLIPVCIDHWDEISGQADLQHKKALVVSCNRMTVNTILKELRRDGYIASSKKQKYVLTELGIETVEKAKDIK